MSSRRWCGVCSQPRALSSRLYPETLPRPPQKSTAHRLLLAFPLKSFPRLVKRERNLHFKADKLLTPSAVPGSSQLLAEDSPFCFFLSKPRNGFTFEFYIHTLYTQGRSQWTKSEREGGAGWVWLPRCRPWIKAINSSSSLRAGFLWTLQLSKISGTGIFHINIKKGFLFPGALRGTLRSWGKGHVCSEHSRLSVSSQHWPEDQENPGPQVNCCSLGRRRLSPAPTFPPAFAEGPSSYPILALLDEPSPLGRLSTPQSSGELVPHSMLSWVVQNPEGGGCKETFSGGSWQSRMSAPERSPSETWSALMHSG